MPLPPSLCDCHMALLTGGTSQLVDLTLYSEVREGKCLWAGGPKGVSAHAPQEKSEIMSEVGSV